MSKIIRPIAVVAFVFAALVAFAGTASAQESPTYTGVSPTTAVAGGDVSGAGASAGAAAPVSAAGTLPYTGNDSLPLVQVGAALIGVGALATLAVRKRNAAKV